MNRDSNRRQHRSHQRASEAGLLTARPTSHLQMIENAPGVVAIGLATERDTLLYIPTNYTPEQPTALGVLLHGAGGEAGHGLSLLQGHADEHTMLLIAPSSRHPTWDVLVGGFGPDVELIDQALDHVFTRYNVDSAHVAIGGFSDGASYALSLGLANGELFSHIVAFSPGFMAPPQQVGNPHIFISHGTHDTVLPIDACSRKLVPRLRRANYDVLYREFNGPHTVPLEIREEAVQWFKG